MDSGSTESSVVVEDPRGGSDFPAFPQENVSFRQEIYKEFYRDRIYQIWESEKKHLQRRILQKSIFAFLCQLHSHLGEQVVYLIRFSAKSIVANEFPLTRAITSSLLSNDISRVLR